MKIIRPAIVISLVACLAAAPILAAPPPVNARGPLPSLAPMLSNVLPGVVSIAVQGRVPAEQNPLLSDPFFRRFFGNEEPAEQEFQAVGSGVIIDGAKGYVITNNHVVEHADSITVTTSDGRHLRAKKIGTDAATDVAVVQVAVHGLHGVPLGNSDELRVGDYVVAVGNPFGLQQTATAGIVSALGRSDLGIEGYESFIQTDASINPGNSGGALVNLRGELVGINTAIVGPSGGSVGIGFAIPINIARRVADQLIAYGRVRRGQLGVAVQDLTPPLAKALKIRGDEGHVVIAQVAPNSPAAKAGLLAGDVVVALNGEKVAGASELRNKIGLLPADAVVTLDIVRNGKKRTVRATLLEPKLARVAVPSRIRPLAGVVLGSIDPGSPLYGQLRGAVVLEIGRGSRAAEAGLLPGDVIVGVNQQAVHSPEDVIASAGKIKGEILLEVVRDGGGLLIVVG